MKKTNLFKALCALTCLVAVVAVIAAVTGCVDFGALGDLFGSASLTGGGTLLAAGGAGVVVTDGESSAATSTVANLEDAELVDQDLDKDITLFSPDRYPLDTITRNYARKKKKAKAQKVQYPQIGYKPMADNLDSSATGAGTTAQAPCSAFTFNKAAVAYKVYIKPVNIDIWRKHDTLLMRDLTLNGTKDKPDYSSENTFTSDQMFWVSDKSGDTLELTPIGGMPGIGSNANKFVVPSFTVGTLLVRMGQAKHELDMTTDPYAMNPELFDQYCQNFMAQIEESTFQALTQTKKVDIGFSDYESDNINSMRGEMEATFLWGARGEIREGNDTVLFTGGICRNIDKVAEYGKGNGDLSITAEQYTQWMELVFTGNCGSKERILLAGSKLISALSLLRESQKNVSGSNVEETYLGVRCTKIVHELGLLRVIHAPLFDETGWENRGCIIDVEHLYKKDFIALHAQEIDLKGSGQKNAKAKVLQEVSCMVLRYPDCHALVRPKA